MEEVVARVILNKTELRNRALAFSKRWAGTHSEKSDGQRFWIDFFAIFGLNERDLGTFEALAQRLSTGGSGYIDYLSPGEMAVEHKSSGEDLDKAMDQLFDYLTSLSSNAKPRLLVACDFGNFYWQDVVSNSQGRFPLDKLSENLEIFWWLAGHRRADEPIEDEEALNLRATALMASIHDAVLDTKYDPHHLREWLTRILFCLFADDTEVWDRRGFENYIHLYTSPDGSDLGPRIAMLFQVLNTPPSERAATLDQDLASFTYINGDLFADDPALPIPFCNAEIRDHLLAACRFDWAGISPAIFGSMFQNVMTPHERRELGAHYTTEANILRTIRPLFLDELEAELEACRTLPSLQRFHEKLAELRFLDPACGCGNFLVIAYRELRRLETRVLHKLAEKQGLSGQSSMNIDLLMKVTVGQFYGIEIEEFPARIARTALYLMDHQENRLFSHEFGHYYARFPIPTSPHITIGNALRIDWNDMLPSDQCSYVMGNPPFVGMAMMTKQQQDDNRFVFDAKDAKDLNTGRMDYVACWYEIAMKYIGSGPARVAFVSTNSITQGEQARAFGPLLSRRGFEIIFAHRTFAWTSEASGMAHVHVVIIGFEHKPATTKRSLFDYPNIKGEPVKQVVPHINGYLAAAPEVAIGKHTRPFLDLPVMTEGNRPEDNGGLIVSDEEADAIRKTDPVAAKFLRRFIGSKDMLRGERRWCLWLLDASPTELLASPEIQRRLAIVREARLASIDKTTNDARKEKMRQLANRPALFAAVRQPSNPYLCIPRVSSENRRVVPMRMAPAEDIASDTTLTLDNAPLWLFGILQSAMFMAWVRAVSGRLKSDIRLTPDIAYNAFPFPDLDDAKRKEIADAMSDVLAARDRFPDASLSDLYDQNAMPPALSDAHDKLDRVVDRLYRGAGKFATDAERLIALFDTYKSLTEPLLATSPKKGQR
jgi:N-6 DNA Methylase